MEVVNIDVESRGATIRGLAHPVAIATMAVTVLLAGSSQAAAQQGCPQLVLSPTSAHFGVAGGTGTFTFPGGGVNCTWVVTAPAAWVTITAPSPLTGNGGGTMTVMYTVAPNSMVVSRTTGIVVTVEEVESNSPVTATHTITQDGQPACPAISLNPVSVPGGTAGVPYPAVVFSASGGVPPVVVGLASGTLPAGLTFSGSTLSGTPTQTGTFSFTVAASDANQCPGGRSYVLVIDCPPIDISPSSLPDGMTGVPYPTTVVTASGGVAPLTVSFDGDVPDGMTFANGEISGTPTRSGTFTVSVTVTDVNGCTASRTYTFVVTGELIITQRGPGRGSAFGEIVSTQTFPGLPAGTIVKLSAEPRYDSSFAGWSGDPDCQDGSVTVFSSMICVANFVRVPLGPSVYLNNDCEADVFTYGLPTGAWSREILTGQTFRSERMTTAESGWLIRATNLNADDRFTDFVGYNQHSGSWFKATNDVQRGFRRFSGVWALDWQMFSVEVSGGTQWDVFLYNPITGVWRLGVNVGPGDFHYVDGAWGTNWEVYPVEFNGDARTDLFLHDVVTGRYLRAINDGNGDFVCSSSGQSCQDPALIPSVWETDWEIYPGDFDGNGQSDLLQYNTTTGVARILVTGADGTAAAVVPVSLQPGSIVQVGDLNGDGADDLFLYDQATGAWTKATRSGTTFTVEQGVWEPGWIPFLRHAYPLIDLRADIVMYNETTGFWFQAFNGIDGVVFSQGFWGPGLDIFAQVPSLPGRDLERPGSFPRRGGPPPVSP